jgi:membrane protease YdiL (CAAX protease family)
VDESPDALPLPSPTPAAAVPESPAAAPAALSRWFAAVQVILVCGIPTQLVLTVIIVLATGMPLLTGDHLSLQLFSTVTLLDTAVIALLIRLFLALSGESAAQVFVGRRPIRGEVLRGLALLPVVFIAVTVIVLVLRTIAPWTHTVDKSPLEGLMNTPLDAAIFLVVVVLAGGVREELQRAFILHRFDQRLGGVRLGLTLFTLLFGALHVDQGVDVAVAVGLLGLLWGILYIRRRSAVAPMVNHASFNAAQVLQAVIARSLGA